MLRHLDPVVTEPALHSRYLSNGPQMERCLRSRRRNYMTLFLIILLYSRRSGRTIHTILATRRTSMVNRIPSFFKQSNSSLPSPLFERIDSPQPLSIAWPYALKCSLLCYAKSLRKKMIQHLQRTFKKLEVDRLSRSLPLCLNHPR